MRVKVHPHRNKIKWGEECAISVKPPTGPVEYYSCVRVENVLFKVSKPGYERAMKEEVRNVHAWAIGDLTDSDVTPVDVDEMINLLHDYKPIQYSPRMGPRFYEMFEGSPLWPVVGADIIFMFKDKCYAKGLHYEQ